MDCHDAKERLREERHTAALDRHLERCGDCASFRAELDAGGREIGEAFLSRSPSVGFEDRVARRLAETEIAVSPRRPRRLPAALGSAALLLVLAAGYLAIRGGGDAETPRAGEDPEPEAPVVVTAPKMENVLAITMRRIASSAPTRVDLRFAGIQVRRVPGDGLEDAVFRLWVRGARRARIVVGARVPGREMLAVQEILEKAGFAYTLVREMDPRLP